MIFKIEKKLKNSLGRAGIIKTSHGDINTPAFVPVGTKATIKSLTPEQVKNLGAEVILANTYHLYLQPGDEQVAKAGGLHEFMNWQMPIITDSGGFQVFSLGAAYGKDFSKIIRGTELTTQIPERSSALDGVPKLASIGNDGVSFRSHIDGSLHYITPEKSIQIQHNLGADIIFAFDEATSPYESYVYQEEALSRTHAWAKRSLEEHQRLKLINTHPPAPSQRDGEFGYHTTDKMTWIALQDRAIEMRKNPTEVENILWESLRKNFTGFHFRRQHIIGNFIVDFLCLEKSIVRELFRRHFERS
jgi:tRNA-guanine family transglycosylase